MVNSFPLPPFSMYVWTSAALWRVLIELCGTTVGCIWPALACTLLRDPCRSQLCTRHKLFRCNCPGGFNKKNSFNHLGPFVRWPYLLYGGLTFCTMASPSVHWPHLLYGGLTFCTAASPSLKWPHILYGGLTFCTVASPSVLGPHFLYSGLTFCTVASPSVQRPHLLYSGLTFCTVASPSVQWPQLL